LPRQLPLAPIKCPTLLIEGTADKDVLPSRAEYAHATIPGSELYWIAGGSHLGFWTADGAEAAQDYALSWLRQKLGI
jgi:pimeloyl-ACP methyl ester carboxylesterase